MKVTPKTSYLILDFKDKEKYTIHLKNLMLYHEFGDISNDVIMSKFETRNCTRVGSLSIKFHRDQMKTTWDTIIQSE